ncbi:MAG: hypothetical protein QXY65_04370 [Candidatus Methanomethylicaceae archaeon]
MLYFINISILFYDYFKRERIPIKLVIYGIHIYIRSRSLRLTSEILEPLIKRSYESIRKLVL